MNANNTKSICAFIHYCDKEDIPYCDKVYIKELSRFFDEVRIITNKLSFLNIFPSNVKIQFEENERYDFGFFYKFFCSINKSEYHAIACINDSNLLINKLDSVFEWGKKQEADFWGIIDSSEKPWFSEHENNYHLQSHFMVFRDNAISKLEEYINSLNVTQIFDIADKKELRRRVINDWKIGLSVFFREKGIPLASYLKSSEFNKKYNKKATDNSMYKLPEKLLSARYPLVKKKMLRKKLTRKFFRSGKWKKLIVQSGNKDWQLARIVEEIKNH